MKLTESPTRIHTSTGQGFDPLRPSPADVRLEDIATSLSNTCRFRGQIPAPGYYSVAQHAVYVAAIVMRDLGDPAAALLALHHDDAEAYLVDAPRPIKSSIMFLDDNAELLTFEALEYRVFMAICKALNLPRVTADFDGMVREADNSQLAGELEGLFRDDSRRPTFRPIAVTRENLWSPEDARRAYLQAHITYAEMIEDATKPGIV